jgi:dolichol-phosphate mannosyltransferase
LIQLRTSFARYLLVGFSGTLVNLASLALLANLPIARFLAAVISTEISIIHNFLIHDGWTFKDRRKATLKLIRFSHFQVFSLFTATFTVGLFALFNSVLGWHYLFSQFVAIGLATILNFLINFHVTWGHKVDAVAISSSKPSVSDSN